MEFGGAVPIVTWYNAAIHHEEMESHMTPQEMETAIARLFEGQGMLTGKVTELTDDVTELSNTVKAMRDEAEADRRVQREAIEEMRTAVGTMLGIAESMAANVILLTQAQQGLTHRVNKIEDRLDNGNGSSGS
jgi:methyl-accepting chemotaxis protein